LIRNRFPGGSGDRCGDCALAPAPTAARVHLSKTTNGILLEIHFRGSASLSWPTMGKRQRKRRPVAAEATTDYRDAEGNVLTLRDSVSEATVAKLREPSGGAAASTEDRWRRRAEMLFERFAVRWTIAELPLSGQKELLGRYRLADEQTQRWVREMLAEHVRRHHPELERP
jgi:hypothetical protein